MRKNTNNNSKQYTETTYQGLPVMGSSYPLSEGYLASSHAVFNRVLSKYSRVLAIRFDLRLPQQSFGMPDNDISRFIEIFKYKIRSDLQSKKNEGKRVHDTDVDFIWVKEQNDSHNHHYHVVVFLNNDTYPNLGNFNNHRGNLSSRICQAWASALKVDYIDAVRLRLVHFCNNGCYWLDKNSPSYDIDKYELFFRISYLSKLQTKHYGDYKNSFGCSRIKR